MGTASQTEEAGSSMVMEECLSFTGKHDQIHTFTFKLFLNYKVYLYFLMLEVWNSSLQIIWQNDSLNYEKSDLKNQHLFNEQSS